MRPVSPKVKKLLLADPYMKQCRLCGSEQVQFHHIGLLGYQQDEVWAIQPACIVHHKAVDTDKNVKHFFELMAIRRMTLEDQENHPKWDWNEKEKLLYKGLPEHLKKIADLYTTQA